VSENKTAAESVGRSRRRHLHRFSARAKLEAKPAKWVTTINLK